MNDRSRIIISPASGFCFGVKSAINIVLSLVSENRNGTIFIDGELVHNKKVNSDLSACGVKFLSKESKINSRDTIVIRAHGISLERRNYLNNLGCKIIDATCPLVAKIANVINLRNYCNIILLGDRNHAEVIGLKSYAKNISVCENLEELNSLIDIVLQSRKNNIDVLEDLQKEWHFCKDLPWVLVCQSTLDLEFFDDVKETLSQKGFEIEIFDTICSATKQRQNGVKNLYDCDVVIVIGGKNSANTKRLFEKICDHVLKVFFVESAAELPEIDFKKNSKIGIAAGASTPPELIEEVYNKVLKNMENILTTQKKT